jgi:hypothetical protein
MSVSASRQVRQAPVGGASDAAPWLRTTRTLGRHDAA